MSKPMIRKGDGFPLFNFLDRRAGEFVNIDLNSEIKGKTIYCTSVNDPFVMNSWFDNLNIQNVRSLPDGNGDLANSLGMSVSKRNLNFGHRSWRYALLIDGTSGNVIEVFAEPEKRDMADDDSYVASTPEAVLKWLQANPQ